MDISRERRPAVGLSANVLAADPDRNLYGGRPLQYLEQSMATWLMRAGARPYLIPFAPEEADVEVRATDAMAALDGLVLQGGSDISPEFYGEEPMEGEEVPDGGRDRYEQQLLETCLDLDLPVLGICRGVQLINVAFGGTLIRRLEDRNQGLRHRDREAYDEHTHRVAFEAGGRLRDVYGVSGGEIVSVHHQAIDRLGDGLVVEARADGDGIVEAIRLDFPGRYVIGVQWHPEFQDPSDDALLAPMPIVDDFLDAVCERLGSTEANADVDRDEIVP